MGEKRKTLGCVGLVLGFGFGCHGREEEDSEAVGLFV